MNSRADSRIDNLRVKRVRELVFFFASGPLVVAVSTSRDSHCPASIRPDLLTHRRERLSRPNLPSRLPEETILDRRGNLRVPDDRRQNADSGVFLTFALVHRLSESRGRFYYYLFLLNIFLY